MKRLTIELDKELFAKIKIYCAEHDISIKDYITNLIINDLK